MHRAEGIQSAATSAPFSQEELQKYIIFAKTIQPALTEGSYKVLVDCYRLLRQNDLLGKNKTAYRITVRQLESLVRLSEALARLHLDPEVRQVDFTNTIWCVFVNGHVVRCWSRLRKSM